MVALLRHYQTYPSNVLVEPHLLLRHIIRPLVMPLLRIMSRIDLDMQWHCLQDYQGPSLSHFLYVPSISFAIQASPQCSNFLHFVSIKTAVDSFGWSCVPVVDHWSRSISPTGMGCSPSISMSTPDGRGSKFQHYFSFPTPKRATSKQYQPPSLFVYPLNNTGLYSELTITVG